MLAELLYGHTMKLADPTQTSLLNEVKLMLEQLPFDGAQVLELGCGKAEKTRLLAETGRVGGILALEVDTIQHERNLLITDLPNVRLGSKVEIWGKNLPVNEVTKGFGTIGYELLCDVNQRVPRVLIK